MSMSTDSSLAAPAASRSRPINLAASGPKHLFELAARKQIRLLEREEYAAADLIVFPYGGGRFDTEVANLPPALLARAAAGEVGIVFDGSNEGFTHTEARTAAQHGYARRLGASPRRCVYLTQDRGYPADYAAYCDRAGIAERMTILNYDYWIKRFFVPYEKRGEAVFAERLEAYRQRARSRSRRFISLNLTPRPTKVLFLLRLLRDGLWEQGYISLGGFEHLAVKERRADRQAALEVTGEGMRALPGFADLAAELTPGLTQLDAMGEILLGEVDTDATTGVVKQYPNSDTLIDEHDHAWFTVVTETEMAARPCRITEKPFKALVNFHPLILLGNPGALAMIRRLGFSTFAGYFDEAYDEEPNPRARFDMVYAQVERLCRMDEADLARMDQEISEVAISNAKWGLTELPRIYRKKIDAALLKAIMAAVGPDRSAHA